MKTFLNALVLFLTVAAVSVANEDRDPGRSFS
jgi:hypothetical protein